MEIKDKEICGRVVKVHIYGEKMRLYVNGTFYPVDTAAHSVPEHLRVTPLVDGSCDVCTTILVSAKLTSDELDEMADRILNQFEDELHIPSDCLSSSSWNAGHQEDKWDALLPAEDREYISKYV